MLQALFDLLFPSECCHCRGESDNGKLLCCRCSDLLELLDPHGRCPRCFSTAYSSVSTICGACQERGGASHLLRAAAALEYAGPAVSLVKQLKSGGCRSVAKGMASFIVLQFLSLGWELPGLIVPVPASRLRRFKRGFNQSALIAVEVGKMLGVPALEPLARSHSYSQASLSRSQRLLYGGKGIYLKRERAKVEGASVLVIDDVMTTGTTLQGCSKALIEGGALRVEALAFAMTPLAIAPKKGYSAKKIHHRGFTHG
jgi:ComF family protein